MGRAQSSRWRVGPGTKETNYLMKDSRSLIHGMWAFTCLAPALTCSLTHSTWKSQQGNPNPGLAVPTRIPDTRRLPNNGAMFANGGDILIWSHWFQEFTSEVFFAESIKGVMRRTRRSEFFLPTMVVWLWPPRCLFEASVLSLVKWSSWTRLSLGPFKGW